jgi:hypothetical protein
MHADDRNRTPDPADPRDAALDRALQALPTPRAPWTLLPRVMAAVQAQPEPVRGRPWFTWAPEWQIASLAALIVAVAAGALLASHADVAFRFGVGLLGDVTPNAATGVQDAVAFASATRMLWQALFQPVLGYVVVWILLMSLACAAFGAALSFALGGASQS